MAENIIQFQDGREARIAGHPRDRRRSADWLEGWDQEEKDVIAAGIAAIERGRIIAEICRRNGESPGATACPDCGSFDHFECFGEKL